MKHVRLDIAAYGLDELHDVLYALLCHEREGGEKRKVFFNGIVTHDPENGYEGFVNILADEDKTS